MSNMVYYVYFLSFVFDIRNKITEIVKTAGNNVK